MPPSAHSLMGRSLLRIILHLYKILLSTADKLFRGRVAAQLLLVKNRDYTH